MGFTIMRNGIRQYTTTDASRVIPKNNSQIFFNMNDKEKRTLISTSLGAILGGGVFALLLWAVGRATLGRALLSGLAIAIGVILVQGVKYILQSKKSKK